VVCDGEGLVTRFQEKPILREHWISAGFFAFEKKGLDQWVGKNLEVEVLPHLADIGQLFAYRHEGFFRSMDSSRDQHELDQSVGEGTPPWMSVGTLKVVGARGQ
jgi:glucose-1-phosphate cytidylyltransferase